VTDEVKAFKQGDLVRGQWDPNPLQDYLVCAGPDEMGRFLIAPVGSRFVMSWVYPHEYYLSASPNWVRPEDKS